MALKLVLPGDYGSGALALSCQSASECRCMCGNLNDFGDCGAAMLLQQIGSEVPKLARKQLFETLGGLHAANIVHGTRV